MEKQNFTVGDLRRQLQGLDDNVKLSFEGGLEFNRLKRWAEDEFVIEFCEAQGYLDARFKKKNPQVKVVFIDTSTHDGAIDVSVR